MGCCFIIGWHWCDVDAEPGQHATHQLHPPCYPGRICGAVGLCEDGTSLAPLRLLRLSVLWFTGHSDDFFITEGPMLSKKWRLDVMTSDGILLQPASKEVWPMHRRAMRLLVRPHEPAAVVNVEIGDRRGHVEPARLIQHVIVVKTTWCAEPSCLGPSTGPRKCFFGQRFLWCVDLSTSTSGSTYCLNESVQSADGGRMSRGKFNNPNPPTQSAHLHSPKTNSSPLKVVISFSRGLFSGAMLFLREGTISWLKPLVWSQFRLSKNLKPWPSHLSLLETPIEVLLVHLNFIKMGSNPATQ